MSEATLKDNLAGMDAATLRVHARNPYNLDSLRAAAREELRSRGMEMPPTLIRRQLIRDMPNGSRVIANLEVRFADEARGLSPAFSLTGEIFERHSTMSGATRHGRYKRLISEGLNVGPSSEPEISGCIHDEILRAFPTLTQFAQMHLADPVTGEPMHAEANGWYWYAGSRADLRTEERYTGFNGIYKHQLDKYGLRDDDAGRQSYCELIACETLRVEEIPHMATHTEDDKLITAREQFAQFVADQRPRWQREAKEALAFVESLPA